MPTFFFRRSPNVANAFVLVRVGRTQAAHFGGNLSDFLAIDAGYAQLRLLGVDGNVNPGGQRVLDGVRVAEREHDSALALHLGAITDADDFQFAGPALGDTFDGVVD